MSPAPTIQLQVQARPSTGHVDTEIGIQPEGPILVTWASDDDPANPKNWPYWRRFSLTLLLSLGGLVTLMSGAMMAPAMSAIAWSLRVNEEETSLALSIFVLAFAFGPLVLAPCSEVFGRVPVWLCCSAWYTVWNLACGFAPSKGVMVLARFMAGFGASAEYAVTSPILSDVWRPEERGKALALATFIPFLGPALGPILGGVITESLGWRWLFYVLSIYDTALIALALMLFRETHEPTLLRRRAAQLTKATGLQHLAACDAHGSETLLRRLTTGLARPYKLFVTQPILQLMSLFLAYNYGVLYIVLALFATVWIEEYHQSVQISGVHYLGLIIGCIIAAQIGGPLMDRLWRYLQAKHGGSTAPEYRVPLMLPSIVLIPAGLFWYGWSVAEHAHWAVVDAGIGVFGCGIILGTQSMQAYVMDAFPGQVASATAASQFLRNIFAFAFPIFAPSLYMQLGYGWGNSLLAFLFLVFGVPAPFALWIWGAKLRRIGEKRQQRI